MPDKKPPKPKPQLKPSLSQKERFIEYAKEVEADESGETFEKAIEKIKNFQPDK
jgi:hypothetical protein